MAEITKSNENLDEVKIEEQVIENSNLTAKEFFEIIKSRKNTIDHEGLKNYYDNCLQLIKKFEITGQKSALNKLKFHITCMEKEMKLIDLGIDKYVLFSDIKSFIEKTEDDDVFFVEMADFPREIPDEIIPLIESTKDIFTNFYILFTDYTEEVKEEIKKAKKKEKDPILFGAFVKDVGEVTKLERFYYLGDWIDEFCDLTLEKIMESGVKVNTISTKSFEELKEDINTLKEAETTALISNDNSRIISTWYSDTTSTVDTQRIVIKDIPQYEKVEKKKESFISKVKTWLTK